MCCCLPGRDVGVIVVVVCCCLPDCDVGVIVVVVCCCLCWSHCSCGLLLFPRSQCSCGVLLTE